MMLNRYVPHKGMEAGELGRHFKKTTMPMIKRHIRSLKKEFGPKKVKAVFLVGGAARDIMGDSIRKENTASTEEKSIMRGYNDVDLLVIVKNHPHAFRKKCNTKIPIDEYIRNDKWARGKAVEQRLDTTFTMIESIPVYNQKTGFAYQKEAQKEVRKRIGSEKFDRYWADWKEKMKLRHRPEGIF